MTTIVTGWTGRGYDKLGLQFGETFDRYWPEDVSAVAYVDPALRDDPRQHRPELAAYFTAYRSLAECTGLAQFIARHKDDPRAHGRAPTPTWKPKAHAERYSWRHDAVKFATQLFIPAAAATHCNDGEVLAWFDADVVTHRKVPEGFVEGLLGTADVVFLGREPKHSEIGFWAVRLNERTRAFLEHLSDMYRSDEVFQLREWHSAFVWDHVRKEFFDLNPRPSPLRIGLARDLTPGGRGHVWHQSPLCEYTDHLKGARKARGRSPERRH